jgi:hypothetical protein
MMATVSRISEVNEMPPSLEKLARWTALNHYVFTTTQVALVCADPKVLPSRKMYSALVFLANAVYWLNYGKPSNQTRSKAKSNLIRFAADYLDVMGKKHTVPKYHYTLHEADFLDEHGPVYLYDSFNLERFLHDLLKTITTKRLHEDQVVTNFLLKFFSTSLSETEMYGDEVIGFLEDLGINCSKNFCKLGSASLDKTKASEKVSQESLSLLCSFLDIPEDGRSKSRFQVVKRMKFRNLTLTSARFMHTGRVNDSYVQVDELCYGQIQEIVQVDDSDRFLVILHEYRKEMMYDDTGFHVFYPDNQYPVLPTERYKVFELSDKTFVQKIFHAEHVWTFGGVHEFFMIRPNDFFMI